MATERPAEDSAVEPDAASTEEEDSATVLPLLGFVVFAALVAAGLLIAYRIYPTSVADRANPGFLDNIFNNNLVVFAARLVLFSAALVLAFVAAYIITSIVSWMRLRQWLTRAGPFEVSREAIRALEEDRDFWQTAAIQANTEVQAVSQRLEQSDDLLDQLDAQLREQEAELDRLRETEEGT